MQFLLLCCSKDSPLKPDGACGNSSWAEKGQNEANDMANAVTVYSNDPSATTCKSYKNAAITYFDALEGIRSCLLPASQAEFNKAIDDAKKDVAALDCSGSYMLKYQY